MSAFDDRDESRRRFLKFLLSSPLLAYPGLAGLAAQGGPVAPSKLPDPIMWGPLRTEESDRLPPRSHQRLRFRAGGAAERAAGAFRLHGLGRRRRSDAARESRGIREVPAPAAPPRRREQGRHEHRDPRRALSDPDHPLPGLHAQKRSIRKARSRSRAARKPATICRSSRRRPRPASRTSRRRAARRSGSSSTRRTGGRSRGRW